MTKENKIKISIVVPVYNVEVPLCHCLDSLTNQDLPKDEYEIILIDDGSTDNSLQICKEYSLKHENIIVFSQANAGASAARTRGLDLAKGEYIFFVDSDDYIANNVLYLLYMEASHNRCDILFFNFAVLSENGNLDYKKVFLKIERNVIFSGEDLICNTNDFGSLWKGIYRRAFIDENNIHFTMNIIHQDTDFNLKAYPFAKRLMVIDEDVYFYRYIGESATRTQSISKRQLILYSDFVVCNDIKKLVNSGKLSEKVADIYEKHCSSILLGATIQLFKVRKLFGNDFVRKCVTYSFDNGLYPISGKTYSWKLCAFAKMLNCCLAFIRQ